MCFDCTTTSSTTSLNFGMSGLIYVCVLDPSDVAVYASKKHAYDSPSTDEVQ